MNHLFTLLRAALLGPKALPILCVVLSVGTFGMVGMTAKEIGLFYSTKPASVAQKPAATKGHLDDPASDKTIQPTTTAPSTPSKTQAPATTKPSSGAASGDTANQGGGTSSGTGSGSSGGSGCPSGQIGTPPSCYPAPPAPLLAGKQWQLAWNEEFNGSDYDHSKLTPCFDWNFGGCTSSFNSGREHYDPGQVQVSNGTAKLIAAPHAPESDGACLGGSCTYYSGLLSTARPSATNGSDYLYKFTYGYVEANLKLPATQGFFTAFWMLPADSSFTYNNELDILENLGYDNKTMWMTYSYNGRNDSYEPNTGVNNNGACPLTDLSGGFHKFAADWEPTYVAWYIDGVKCGQYTDASGATIESGPMQIILDLMVDNNWQRSWGEGLLDSSLVRQLEVDYIRVYQQH